MRKLLHPVAAAAIGLFGSAAVAGAVTPGEPFTVAPDEGGPFTTVEVSGANCSEGPEPTIFGTVVGSPDIGVITQFQATADGEGGWAAMFTVPPNKPAGAYEVTARCTTAPDASTGVDYANQPFTVLPGEEATMTVSPRSAPAGEDVRVTVSGTLCRGEGAVVEVGAFVRVPEEIGDADELIDRNRAFPDEQGNWTTEVTLWESVPPGTYGIQATCLVADEQFFLYETTDVVLTGRTAPPAVPVPREPNFTG